MSSFLVGVAEGAHPVEGCLFHEASQLLEFFFGLTGEAYDKRGAESDAGNDTAHLLDRTEEQVRSSAPLHALQDARRGMLQRDINIGADVVVSGDGVEQAAGDFVGIGEI